MQIILASASPRRKELLAQICDTFEVVIPHIDEQVLPGESPLAFCQRISKAKAAAIAHTESHAFIIAADTIVVAGGRILGKPQDHHEAAAFLRLLSDSGHEVFTGYSIYHPGRQTFTTRVVQTRVHFSAMNAAEIAWYIATGEPMDKAGAYAIQGLGGLFIDRIEGSHTNVIGLPLCELYHDLKELGLPLKPMQGGQG